MLISVTSSAPEMSTSFHYVLFSQGSEAMAHVNIFFIFYSLLVNAHVHLTCLTLG